MWTTGWDALRGPRAADLGAHPRDQPGRRRGGLPARRASGAAPEDAPPPAAAAALRPPTKQHRDQRHQHEVGGPGRAPGPAGGVAPRPHGVRRRGRRAPAAPAATAPQPGARAAQQHHERDAAPTATSRPHQPASRPAPSSAVAAAVAGRAPRAASAREVGVARPAAAHAAVRRPPAAAPAGAAAPTSRPPAVGAVRLEAQGDAGRRRRSGARQPCCQPSTDHGRRGPSRPGWPPSRGWRSRGPRAAPRRPAARRPRGSRAPGRRPSPRSSRAAGRRRRQGAQHHRLDRRAPPVSPIRTVVSPAGSASRRWVGPAPGPQGTTSVLRPAASWRRRGLDAGCATSSSRRAASGRCRTRSDAARGRGAAARRAPRPGAARRCRPRRGAGRRRSRGR